MKISLYDGPQENGNTSFIEIRYKDLQRLIAGLALAQCGDEVELYEDGKKTLVFEVNE